MQLIKITKYAVPSLRKEKLVGSVHLGLSEYKVYVNH